ncbi:alpha-hydroxy acid oxidase [Mesorhizobium sp. B2-1-3A]|uniref:alpha-hydroxy acid oxidase n=1 Tax=Mesorhizobium sp. B2-1-3A TaxID=2589971 RepID=UPI00112C4EF7|nr:alpha-hydroxy acid oxidase [Mesorhizobium sp. B2-1-3A]TPM94857.1 alpha-hydroxy-acid oxidizing protein [Mesorhizobium sp. B2-1-3A]
MRRVISISDLREHARRRLPKILFDWIDGGAGDERGLRENEAAFDAYRFLPRYMLDVSQRTQRKALFGKTYASPFGIAPTGYAGLFRPGADLMLAQAAEQAGIPFIMSGTSVSSIEDAAKLAPNSFWYQLYAAADVEITRHLIGRAERAGCQVLVVTIDIPIAGKRERDLRNGFEFPLRMTPRLAWDGLCHPAWTLAYLRTGGLPVMQNWALYAPPGSSAIEVAEFANTHAYCVQTWEHLKLFRDLWPGKLVVKGVMHPHDATMAMRLGADGIYVSNHGGRQYDRSVAAPSVLPILREIVGPDMPLMMDGGVRRGSDIFAALCLGADFVFAGRPTLYGVAAHGSWGAEQAITILRDELGNLMGQIGCLDLEQGNLGLFLVSMMKAQAQLASAMFPEIRQEGL